MKRGIGGLFPGVREVELARPETPMKFCRFGRDFNEIQLAARGSHEDETQGVEDMRDLLHEKESGALVRVRRLSKILLKIYVFLFVIGDDMLATTARSAYRSLRNAASQSASQTRRPSNRMLSGLNKSL